MTQESNWLLNGAPQLGPAVRARLVQDFDRFARDGLPASVEQYLLDAYQIDVSSTFAGRPIKNPWGKASGQLSMTQGQVEDDVAAGLGFVVLKTVIAQDATGQQSMHEWAIREAKMVAEPIIGRSGRQGWTIIWKGRGWWQSFDEYLELIRNSTAIGLQSAMTGSRHAPNAVSVVPSCKYHLPGAGETAWRIGEYEFATRRMIEAYRAGGGLGPMPIEVDFSPTLAGDDRANQKERILDWLLTVPRLVREAAGEPIVVGLKLFNAMFEDEYQLETLCKVLAADRQSRPDFITYANRLFDPKREFEGKTGVAYGGPDLSERNLRVLDAFWREVVAGRQPLPQIPISATGDIHSGRMALEYALRGCGSFQIHTFFQLPNDAYVMRTGDKVARALHLLYFHPDDGLVAWLLHLAATGHIPETKGILRLKEVVRCAATR